MIGMRLMKWLSEGNAFMKKDLSQFAFPGLDNIQESGNGICGVTDEQTGLTKREYFAALAMQALLAAPWHPEMGWSPDRPRADVAVEAVRQANALIEALSVKDPKDE